MALIDDNFALITQNGRMIGDIMPDVTIEEHHSDRLIITEHPVETGAAISDHAFRSPSEVVMKIGFSNSTARTEGWVQEAYQTLLSLQQARQLIDVITGKRPYTSMLIDTLEVQTDEGSEWALFVTVALREIIIVSTQQSGAGGATGISPVAANQNFPQVTNPVQSVGGGTQLKAAPNVGDFVSTQAAIG